ncbi:MAG: maleylacetoacetate isomerase [Idiomarina sp.]|nr:maleylacetoacetate isomerase [Idiomarina sp.]
MKLFGYWRSSASYRVRIGLSLKGIAYDYEPIHLLRSGGEQRTSEYKTLNPAGLVPTLVDDTVVLNQSLAILEYLDSVQAEPRLVPTDPVAAARVRMMALDMAADLQPITNLRILQYLTGTLEIEEGQKMDWIHHWVKTAFQAYELRLAQWGGRYSVGDTVSMADICLVPQVYNAQRFGVDLTDFPRLIAVYDNLQALDAFQRARPEAQPDAEV